jgi:hypothetical protein
MHAITMGSDDVIGATPHKESYTLRYSSSPIHYSYCYKTLMDLNSALNSYLEALFSPLGDKKNQFNSNWFKFTLKTLQLPNSAN